MSAARLSPARLPRAAAFGAGAALGTGLPLSRLPRTTTAVTAGAAVAALVAAGAATGPGEPRTGESVEGRTETGESIPRRGRLVRLAGGLAVGSAIGLVVGGSLWVNLRVDAALEEVLRRRGVTRPRLALALGVGAVTGLLEWVDPGEAGNVGGAAADARADPWPAVRADAHRPAPADADGRPGRADAPAVAWTP